MKSVTILTIARSGSSLLAGILHRLGVDMGEAQDLKKGKHLNKYGCYENQDFIGFSVNILLDVGILLDFRKRLTDYEDKMQEMAEQYRPQFKELIAKYSTDLWGFKEASSIYYLPYLYDEIPNPKYIHLIRNYESTAKSLLDMIKSKNWRPEYKDKIKHFTLKKRWKLYFRILRLLIKERKYRNVESMIEVVEDAHERIEGFLEDKQHITVHLDDIIEDTDNTINKISKYLELEPTDEQLKSINDFIHPELLTKRKRKKKRKKKKTAK